MPFRTRTSNDNASGKIVLQHDFSPEVMAYASYARGYKGPAFNVFFNLTSTGTNVIEAETSDAFEVGLKNTFLDGRLTLNLAGFYAKYHNFQANNPDLVASVVVTRFTNAGEISTTGVEADMSFRLGKHTTLNAGLALTDAQVDKFKVAPGAATTAIIASGTPLGFAPTWKGSVLPNSACSCRHAAASRPTPCCEPITRTSSSAAMSPDRISSPMSPRIRPGMRR